MGVAHVLLMRLRRVIQSQLDLLAGHAHHLRTCFFLFLSPTPILFRTPTVSPGCMRMRDMAIRPSNISSYAKLLLDRRGKRKVEWLGPITEDVDKPPSSDLRWGKALLWVRVKVEFLARADPAEAYGALRSQRRQRYSL